MNPKTTAILAVVAVVLGAGVYWIEIGGEADRKAEAQASLRLFPGVEAGAIDAIAFRTEDGQSVRFERGAEALPGWRLTSLGNAAADEGALEGLATALAELSAQGRVQSAGELAAFGLDPPARSIRFETGEAQYALKVGGTTPVGGYRYVVAARMDSAEEAQASVAFVDSFRLNGFRRSLLDLRDRNLVRTSLSDLDSFELRWPASALRFARTEGGWRLAEPVSESADEEVVLDLLTGLAYWQANGFVADGDAAARRALATPAFELRFDDPASGQPAAIRVGGAYGEGLIFEGPEGDLATVASERLEEVPRTLSAYRDRTLARFDPTEAVRIEMGFGDEGTQELGEGDAAPLVGAIVLERTGEGWRGGDPAVDSFRLADFVARLSNLRAESIVAEEVGRAERAAFGLAPPRLRLRVRGAAREDAAGGESVPLADLRVGRLDPSRGLFLQRAGEDKIYLLDAESASIFPLSRADYRERYSESARGGADAAVDPLPGDVAAPPAVAAEAEADAAAR